MWPTLLRSTINKLNVCCVLNLTAVKMVSSFPWKCVCFAQPQFDDKRNISCHVRNVDRCMSNFTKRMLERCDSVHSLLDLYVYHRQSHTANNTLLTFTTFIRLMEPNKIRHIHDGAYEYGIQRLVRDVTHVVDLEILNYPTGGGDSDGVDVIIELFLASIHYLSKCRDSGSVFGNCCLRVIYKTLDGVLVATSLDMLLYLARTLDRVTVNNANVTQLSQLTNKHVEIYVKIELKSSFYGDQVNVRSVVKLLHTLPYLSYKMQKSLITLFLNHKHELEPQIVRHVLLVLTGFHVFRKSRTANSILNADDKVLMQNIHMCLKYLLRYMWQDAATYRQYEDTVPIILRTLHRILYYDEEFLQRACGHAVSVGRSSVEVSDSHYESVKCLAYYTRAVRFCHLDFLTYFMELVVNAPDKLLPEESLPQKQYLSAISKMVKVFATFSVKPEQTGRFLQLLYERCYGRVCQALTHLSELQEEDTPPQQLLSNQHKRFSMYLAARIVRDFALLECFPEDFVHVAATTLRYSIFLTRSYSDSLTKWQILGLNKCTFSALVVYQEIVRHPPLAHMYPLSKTDVTTVLHSLLKSFAVKYRSAAYKNELLEVLGGPEYVALTVFTETGVKVDFAIVVDGGGQLQRIKYKHDDEYSQGVRFTSDITLPADGSHHLMLIMVLETSGYEAAVRKYTGDYCANCRALLGLVDSKRAHLQYLGYKLLLIDGDEWLAAPDHLSRREYIKDAIEKAI